MARPLSAAWLRASDSVPGGTALLRGQLAAAALALIGTVVVARWLGAEDFGRYVLIVAAVLVASQILDARTWEAATRFASEHLAAGDRGGARASIEMAYAVNLAAGLVAAAVVAGLADPIASGLLGDEALAPALRAYAVVAPFVALQSAAAIPFRVLGDFRSLAALTPLSPALRLIAMAIAIAIGAGLEGLLAMLALAEALAAVVLVAVGRRLMARELAPIPGRARVARLVEEARRARRIILASNAYGTLRLANEQLDVLIVGAVATPAAAGVLKLARTFAQPLTIIQKPFVEAIYPRLAGASAGGRLAAEWGRLRRSTALAATVMGPLAVALCVVSPWLVPALAGSAYADAWQAIVPLALAIALAGTFFWLHPAALACGLQGRSVGALAAATAIQLGLVVVLVPAIGVAGAGIAYGVAFALWIAILAPAVRRRMRSRRDGVIVVGPTPPPYHGTAVMTVRLVGSLRRAGLLAAHLDTQDPRAIASIGRLDARNVWLAVKHSWQFVVLLARHPGADVYVPISQGRLGFLRDSVFLLAARAVGRRRIVHLHGGYFGAFYERCGRPMRALIRTSLGGVAQAWVLTEGLRPAFAGLVPPERVRVVSNSVDDVLAVGTNGGGATPGEERRGATRVLFLSNMFVEKGWAVLLEAIEELGSRVPLRSIHVRFVGEASAEVRHEIRRRSAALGPGIRVEAVGTRVGEAKLEEYRRADLFVYPSRYRYDGQPLVLLEAMAAGLPIIATPLGGIPETVQDGETAVLVAPGEVGELVDALDRAAGDPALRRRLGAAARRRYLERYVPARFDVTVASLVRDRDSAAGAPERPAVQPAAARTGGAVAIAYKLAPPTEGPREERI